MNKVTFGRTGLSASPLGFGAAPIGYLDTDRQRVARILNLLLDAGVNLVDTAAN
jgi:aryl-alcohol dehydrogenase-like predicted oxidoreductase